MKSVFRMSFAASLLASGLLFATPFTGAGPADGMTFERIAGIRRVTHVTISPSGEDIAYLLSVPRKPGVDDDGSAWTELHTISSRGARHRGYIQGEVKVSELHFTPDGQHLTYLARRGDDKKRSLYAIPMHGGESRKLIEHDSGVSSYRVSPDGKTIAYVAVEAMSDARSDARDKGYKQEVFEEDWRHRRLWIAPMPAMDEEPADPSAAPAPDDDTDEDEEPLAVEIDGSVFQIEWSPDSRHLAVAVAPTPLIDDSYMRRRIRIIEASTGKETARLGNPGKLGKFRVSPDGRRVAMISAADPNDPKEGRLLIGESGGGALQELFPRAPVHYSDFAWLDGSSLLFIADRGAETELGRAVVGGGGAEILLRSGGTSETPILRELAVSADGNVIALRGESPENPGEVYVLRGSKLERLTRSNPWLDSVKLARQEVFGWTARDGLALDGVLIRPLDKPSGPAPLLLLVHGGPESHDRNGWLTNYSRPGQLAAARGYAVLYPNYRGSTGRGVASSKSSQGDAAGKEFDDLVDAVKALADAGIADRDRVGIAGGSYGGYATAWCSTRHTEHFRAGVMFVGISNKLSKGLTTEIPVEDKMVHTLFDPWTKWQFSLERSPIYHAEKSRTALLIAGGADDPRVHPSQSLQLYRALKLIDKTPVRYVRYPGEQHGNTKAAARDDYSRRLVRWMDHFVMNKRSGLPAWEAEWAIEEEDEDAEDDGE